MALIAVAADKGSPGVTTAAVALAAVWPRPVLLAECDPAGGDLVYRLPAASGDRLDPGRGLLSLAATVRRGLAPEQILEHAQRLVGGLDVLVGLTSAEQAGGLAPLWGQLGRSLAALPGADVIADCGRVGADGPLYDLLAEATVVVLLTRSTFEEVVRLRERIGGLATGLRGRGATGSVIGVVVVAEPRRYAASLEEVGGVLAQSRLPARLLGGLAADPKGARALRGAWGIRLDRSLLVRSARELAGTLAGWLGPILPETVEPRRARGA